MAAPRSTGPAATRPPRAVDAAALIALVAGTINAAIGVLVLVEAGRSAVTVPAAPLVAIVVIAFGYAAAVVALALLFRAGRPWARPAFFAVASLSLFTIFALNLPNLVVILLLVVAVVLLYRPSVSEWARSLRRQ